MLDFVWQLIAPFLPGLLKVVTDIHDAISIQSYFADKGAETEVVSVTGPMLTSMLVALRSRFANGSLRCPRDGQLVEDLRRVKARDATEAVSLPRFSGGHCDMLSALALAVRELGGEFQPAAWGAASLPGGGWSDTGPGVTVGGSSGDPKPGSPEYYELSQDEQYRVAMAASGLGTGGAGFVIPGIGQQDRGYDSPGAPAWLSSPGGYENDW